MGPQTARPSSGSHGSRVALGLCGKLETCSRSPSEPREAPIYANSCPPALISDEQDLEEILQWGEVIIAQPVNGRMVSRGVYDVQVDSALLCLATGHIRDRGDLREERR